MTKERIIALLDEVNPRYYDFIYAWVHYLVCKE